MSPQTIDLASFDITIEEFCWQAEESTIKLTFAVDQCRFITTCSASILGGKLSDKLKQNMFSLTSDYNRLTSESSYSDRIKVGLEAIKKLHEALRKGMERLRKDLFKATIKDSVDSTANYISSKVTGEEMVSLVQEVKESTCPSPIIPGMNNYDSD